MSVWDEFFERHKRRNFTPAFNARLEAMIADESLEPAVRFEALVLRRSWGNHSDCAVFEDGVLMTRADCARELGVSKQAITLLTQVWERSNYLRMIGREIHPVDDPLEGRSAFANCSPKSNPFRTMGEEKEKTSAPEPEENNSFTLEDYIQTVFQTEDPVGYRAYQEAARAYSKWRIRLLEKFKIWQRDRESDGDFRPSSERAGQSESPKGSDDESERVEQSAAHPLYENRKRGIYSQAAQDAPESSPEAAAEDRWKALLFAADHGWLRYGDGELPTIRRAWGKLSGEERLAAIEGIKLRIETGEYGDTQYVPHLVNYIRKKLWTAKPKPKSASRVASDAKQRAREEFMRRVAEDLEYERRQQEDGEGGHHA